ncbi:MAG: mannitol-1-phosphate 5-dehydrogenase, partial [Bacteroidales bacterium]|nr:mannitol-1-phosphate 5-dehydrogenase [Bacteroidales bacterium]
MKKAVQFGAGNIGRGFIGELESLSGYQVVFADVVQPLIDGINADGHYTVHITDVKPRDITVSDISAVNSGSEDIKEEVASAEVITTAVGLGVLPKIAPALAGALSYRFSKGIKDPVNVIACENALRASSKLKEFVYGLLSDDDKAEADRSVGFADCSVDRIVPPIRSANLDVSVEEFYEWNVERSQIVGTPPVLKGMNLVEDVMAYEQRKLFTLNTAHAVAAYFGYAKGFDTIAKSIADETVFPFVMGAVRESGDALCREFG